MSNIRFYRPADSITFRKTNEAFGGLSNMASGYVVWVNGVRILSTEALYQACRFPHLPEVQRSIIMQASPMTAKMKSKPYRDQSRADWNSVRLNIMRWCLRVKLAQHWDKFGDLLLSTGDKSIVEDSRKDQFWGAVMNEHGQLEGRNALGRLLMELREELKGPNREALRSVQPADIPDFVLYGEPIRVVEAKRIAGQEEGKRLRPLGTRKPDEPAPTYATPEPKVDLFSEPAMQKSEPRVKESLKPYHNYKPAGVPWLQQVPEHWEVRPGLSHLHFKQVKNIGMVEKQVLSLSYGRIVIKPQEKLKGLVPESFETYQIVDPGDIIIRATDLQNDRTSLRVGEVKDRGIITSAYLCLNVHDGMLPAFGYNLIHAYDLMKWLYGYGSGLRQNLDWVDFKRMPLVVPPHDEQHLIVRYLHAVDAKVKRYIRTKRKLIAALQEQKQAIIQRAVTRGLDTKAKLKPSGVEWLGDVPEHWEVFGLGRVVHLLTGFPFKSDDFSRDSGDVRLLRGINIAPTGIRWDEVVYWRRDSDDELEAFELREGDIVLGMDRPIISSGVRATTIGANDVPALLLQRVARLRPTSRLHPSFLLLLLKGHLFTSYMEPIFTGISVPHLSPKQIRGFTIALPSIEEQQMILQRIASETSATDEAVSLAYREIEVLQEYHTRLIADVVTGAVDVTAVAKAMAVDAENQTMDEEPLSMAAEGEAEYGVNEE